MHPKRFSAHRWLPLFVLLLLAACGGGTTGDQSTTAPQLAPSATPAGTATAMTPARPSATATRPLPTPTTISAPPPPTATLPPAPTSTPPPTPTPDPCPGAIPWDQAAAYAGQQVTVIGPVVGATWASQSRGQPTFLNLGLPYPDPARFTVLIWIDSRGAFPAPPEELYAGRIICVSGVVELYQGSAEMEITGPEQITVVP